MKTLKLSSLAAVIACLSLFTACTKDFETTAAPSSTASYDLNETSNAKRGNDLETLDNSLNKRKSKIELSGIDITLSPQRVNINNEVIVTGTIVSPELLSEGVLFFERSAKVDANGDVTAYVPSQFVETDPSFKWVRYNKEIAISSLTPTLINSEYVYKISELFLATEKGDFGWRLHFQSRSNEAFNKTSSGIDLTVIDCVQKLTIEPNVTAENIGNGNYAFTVTYKLTSPVDMDNIKFQGGATSGGQFQHDLTTSPGFEVKHNNQNSVLTYAGSLKACTPLELSFTYIRKFNCPATDAAVTGEWKLESNNIEVAKVAPLLYTCN